MKVLAIDPGKANGWAVLEDGRLLDSGVADQEQLYSMLEGQDVDHVVYESYRLYATHSRQMIGDEFLTPQIIGVIQYICNKRGMTFSEQPATTKKFHSDAKLKEMGLYVPIDHRRDAIRHGLYYFRFRGGK